MCKHEVYVLGSCIIILCIWNIDIIIFYVCLQLQQHKHKKLGINYNFCLSGQNLCCLICNSWSRNANSYPMPCIKLQRVKLALHKHFDFPRYI